MSDTQTYTPAQGARWMAKQGVPITPLNGKIPFGNAWQDAATNDVTELNILAQTHKGNFGCVAKKGEFWMVDEDVVGFFERFTQETGVVLDTLFVNSSAGRRHGYFKASPESDELFGKNIPEKLLGGAASVRWHNQQCVCPFSVHPTHKTPYLPVDIKATIKPAPVEFIRWILAQVKAEPKTTAAAGQPRQKIEKGGRDHYLFTRASALRAQGLEQSEIETVVLRENQELCVPPVSTEQARKCIQQGSAYEKGDPTPTVTIEGRLPGEAPVKQLAAAAAETKSNPWPPVTPLEDKLSPVAVFKPEFLPDSIRPWVTDVSERMSVPLDFAGICALGTIAGVIGRRAFVCPKAKDKDWKEAIALSGAVIADSGKAKTPTWKTFTNVVVEKENDWNKRHAQQTTKFEEDLESWEALSKANKEIEKKSGVAQNTPPPPEEPAPCRCLILNDATPEKMHDIMKKNPCGLFYLRDELSSWVAEFDKEGREQQQGVFLAAMNGNDPYKVERIGREAGSAIMCASVFGGFQPDMFREFLNNTSNVSSGMIPRFSLLVWPDDCNLPIVDRIADDSAKQQYRHIINELAEMGEKQVYIHFSTEAQPIYNDWWAQMDQRVKAEENPGKRSHLAKYKGVLPKIAALLQIIDLVSVGTLSGNLTIDVSHLTRAIDLLVYLETHMHRVYDCIQNPIQKAESAIAKLIEKGDLKSRFTIRVIQRKHRRDLSKAEYIDLALETLEEKCWVRKVESEPGPKGGRPVVYWNINPALLK
jgi:Protein of unknown function (DUF3987)/Bifunctional DNA primase/polymerase, N-terminal